MDKPDFKKFMEKMKKMEKNELADLSSGEDLSIGIMNLISIEEHLFFTYGKTKDEKYLDLLNEVRETRKIMLKKIIKDYEGEVWCLCKHFLAASMRFMEVGTKYLGRGDKKQAEELFKKSYEMYSMFWGLNLGAIESAEISQKTETINLIDDKNDESKSASVFEKMGDIVKKILDCCKE